MYFSRSSSDSVLIVVQIDYLVLRMYPLLLLQGVKSRVARYCAEPGKELAPGLVIIVYLAEGLLETARADVIDVVVVDVLEPVLYVRPQLVDVTVP